MPVDYQAAAQKRARTLRQRQAAKRLAERLTKTRRLCLRCGQPFASEGAHNRLCEICRRTAGVGPFDDPYTLRGRG